MTTYGDRALEAGEIEELQFRIQNDVRFFNGHLPERNSIAWRAYLAGLLDWARIDRDSFNRLISLLPPVTDDPTPILLRKQAPC